MTHLERIVSNEPTVTAYETVAGKKRRIDTVKYDPKKGHTLESNIVVKVQLPRGKASLAINVLETLIAGLESDPVGGIAHLKAVALANRASRATIKPDVATSGKVTVAALPLDADPDAIRKAVKIATDAAVARARKAQGTQGVTAATTPAK